jgi:aspartyl-tRNA synthetase
MLDKKKNGCSGWLHRDEKHALLWVTDFPMFEYDEEQGRWVRVCGV